MSKIIFYTICASLLLFVNYDAYSLELNEENQTSRRIAYLLPEEELPGIKLNEKLSNVLSRIGPNLRAAADYHDFLDIELAESIEGWSYLQKQSELFAQNRVELFKPRLMKLLTDSQVSESCRAAAELTLNSMKSLSSWSVQMWNSYGNFPPTGLTDGQLNDLGSYNGCLNTKFPRDNNQPSINYTSFCVLSFRPVSPSRPKNHMVFNKLPSKLRTRFNETNYFRELIDRAQYFYYIYMKTGICIPHQCSARDVQLVASQIGCRLSLMTGPVKCFTRAPPGSLVDSGDSEKEISFGQIENEPVLVELTKPCNEKQIVSAIIIITFFTLVLLATLWHSIELYIEGNNNQNCKSDKQPEVVGYNQSNHDEELAMVESQTAAQSISKSNKMINKETREFKLIKSIAINYFSAITNAREFLNVNLRSNEIKCLHGIRVITMVWIICVHTLQYNNWDGFTRVFQNEVVLQNIILHPIYNASYVVDNFFFMSGLLAAYTIWCSSCKSNNKQTNFNILTSLLARYLRLTPQVLLISLCYIILPLVAEGPFWYDMTHYSGKYCEKNWWINLLHLQAFYRKDEICNLVGWWISIDMFYYILALGLIYMSLNNETLGKALTLTALLITSFTSITAYKHYTNGYTPNNLGTAPQVAEIWTGFVVNLFWSPYAHVVPFYLGLWIGYVLAYGKWRNQVKNYSKIGWLLSISSMIIISFSTHIWMSGRVELGNQLVSTGFNVICSTIWAISFAWIIIACHYQCAPIWLNEILSTKLFILISKASFIIYLSHMLLLKFYFGSQVALIEVSVINISYIVIGNTFLSTLLGVFLCITFEGPCMKFQRYVIQKLKSKPDMVGIKPRYTDNGLEKSENSNGNNQHNNKDASLSYRVLLKN